MKSKSETIDVIIPTYNSMPWVISAVESVLNQTHRDIKLYVIDDGSTDDTEKSLKRISDTRLHYIKKESNGGSSAARNYGLRMAKSDYVALLDSDDTWYTTKLEEQMRIMSADNSCGLVYCGIYVKDEKGIVTRNLVPYSPITLDELYKGNLVTGSASTVLLRKSVVEQVGGFNEDLVNGEDWEFWLRIAHISKLKYTDKILADITVRTDGIQSNSKRMADELIRTHDYISQNHMLSHSQKVHLAIYCLQNAAFTYEHLKEYSLARKSMYRYMRINLHALLMPTTWRTRVSASPIVRIIFSTSISRLLSRLNERVWRKLDWIADKLYRKIVRK